MKWYVIQAKTGEELRVRNALQVARIPAKVPQERRQIRQGGTWKEQVYTLMPGYVFVGSEDFGPDEYYTAKAVPGFIRFLGAPHPQPISYLEAEYIGLLAPADAPLEPSVVEDGRVVSGVLTCLPQKNIKLEIRRRRARVTLSVMGEEKTVEFSVRVAGAAEVAEDDETEE